MDRGLIRTTLWLAASFFALVASAVSAIDRDDSFVPVFLVLGVVGLTGLWADRTQHAGRLTLLTVVAAAGWVVTAVAAAGLLLFAQLVCACSGPVPPAEANYLGLTPTGWRMLALYGGAAAATAAVLLREPRVSRIKSESRTS